MRKSAIKFDQGTHYYDREGKARYDADLRAARKENLFVSPTTLESQQWKNMFLDDWKMEQLAIAAFENPRQPHEGKEDYCQRIYEISREKSLNAAKFGKRIHDAAEKYPHAWPQDADADLLPYILKFGEWFDKNVGETIAEEITVVDTDIGVAGRLDRVAYSKITGRRTIYDYKTQDIKVDDKGRKTPNFYPSFIRQLAYYSVADSKKAGLFPEIDDCVSLIIDSNPESGVYEKVWEKAEIVDAYQDFLCGAWLWFRGGSKRKPFWPVGYWEPFTVPRPIA